MLKNTVLLSSEKKLFLPPRCPECRGETAKKVSPKYFMFYVIV
jgi:hypothetical protein